jgi:hypothetical protein
VLTLTPAALSIGNRLCGGHSSAVSPRGVKVRTHEFLVTLTVHTNKIKPSHHTDRHIGSLNDDWPPRGRNPERRSTAPEELYASPFKHFQYLLVGDAPTFTQVADFRYGCF